MAKKYNKGRKQKPNLNRRKIQKYREEIAKELGADELLTPSKTSPKEKAENDYNAP
jgi:hypothetical protein